MRRLEDAVAKWLEYEDPIETQTASGADAGNSLSLLSLSMQDTDEPPTQPEALTILRRLNSLNLSYWDGGYAAQPYLLMLELTTAKNAQIDHNNRKAINSKLRMATYARQGQQTV